MTRRERQIVDLYDGGMTPRAIADELGVTQRYVDWVIRYLTTDNSHATGRAVRAASQQLGNTIAAYNARREALEVCT